MERKGTGGDNGERKGGSEWSYQYFFFPGTLGGYSTENYSLPVLDVRCMTASDAGRSTIICN